MDELAATDTPASPQRLTQQLTAQAMQGASDDEYVPDSPLSDSKSDDGHQLVMLSRLDAHIMDLLAAVVQQDTGSGAMGVYASVIVSFCAVRASRVHPVNKTITWQAEGQVSGILSKLIYGCQLVILQLAQDSAQAAVPPTDMGTTLPPLCRRWLVNDTRGPVGVLNDWRLFAMQVGATTVPEGLVVWDDDGRSMTYGAVRYGLEDLCTEMRSCWHIARQIFTQDLCLGVADVLTYTIVTLQDNWSNMFPGYSFVQDSRNTAALEGHDRWLTDQIYQDPARAAVVFQAPSDSVASGQEAVRSTFARQYQISVQQFLEQMMVLVHKGSGQPAR